jgi:Pyruvate/2-oxoacid:ferredoxin oxidoreductase gamma subunit
LAQDRLEGASFPERDLAAGPAIGIERHNFGCLIERKLRPGSLVLYNRTLLADPGECRSDCRWEPVDAGRIAIDRKYAQGQSLVALGAFCALTGIVTPEALKEGPEQLLPSYRHQTIPINVECLVAGAAAVADRAGSAAAWNGGH